MSGGALALYARWQLRDALVRALMPVVIFAGVAGIPLWALVQQHTLAVMRQEGPQLEGAVQVYGSIMQLSMTLGAFVLVSGLLSADRMKQHFRFLFSRPVVPWRFYLQQFAISVVLFVALFSLIPIGFGLIFAPVPIVAVLKSATVYALLFGALALLCGALVNKDGALLIGVVVLATVLQQLERADALPRWAGVLADALPPFVAADRLRMRWLGERAIESGDLALVLLYSLGMLVGALVLIRRAALAR